MFLKKVTEKVMNKIIPTNPLQVKYSQRNLLSTRKFIKYCEDIGIRTSLEELYFLEKEKLLFPAVRIFRGYYKVKKVVKNNKYTLYEKNITPKEKYNLLNVPELYFLGIHDKGTVYSDDDRELLKKKKLSVPSPDDWLNPYCKNKMISFPIEEAFVNPNKRKEAYHEFKKDKKELGWPYIDYYDKYQFLSLAPIQKSLSIHIKNEALFSSKTNLATFSNKKKSFPTLREKVSQNNHLTTFLNEVKKIWIKRNKDLRKFQKNINYDDYDKFSSLNQIKSDFSTIELQQLVEIKKQASTICKKLSISLENIDHYIFIILTYGSFGMFRVKKDYIRKIDEDVLINTEIPYKLANMLSWFLWVMGKKRKTVKQLILHTKGTLCENCHRSFKSKNKFQTYCSLKECQKARMRETVSRKRKTGEYK